MKKILILGYGNPGRVDDGLGPSCIAKLEGLNLANKYCTLDSDYQLTLETASDIAEYDEVIFVDASINCVEPYSFDVINDTRIAAFSTHSVTPQALMKLTETLYGVKPKAWILGIRGYHFNEFGEYLSDKAQVNLKEAVSFMHNHIQEFCYA